MSSTNSHCKTNSVTGCEIASGSEFIHYEIDWNTVYQLMSG